MFTWIIRLCVFAFMWFTMSAVGTEVYISPGIWSCIILAYWFCTHPMHNNPHRR